MKAMYVLILACILLFPLALAATSRMEQPDCRPEEACLPPELKLNTEQKRQLQVLYERHQEQQEALRRQTRDAVLQMLTPEQIELLKKHAPDLLAPSETTAPAADSLQPSAHELPGMAPTR